MALSRRKFLALTGGGVVVAAAAGAGTFVATRHPAKALAPWSMAGQYDDLRLNALSHALLAPNPHNRQPWEAELLGDDTIVLTRDLARDLPETDPFGRQLTIGMGCFLELLVQAGAAAGHQVDLDLFPDGDADGKPVAIARFSPGGTQDPLFDSVFDRRTNREPYDANRPPSAAQIDSVCAAAMARGGVTAAGTAEPARVADLQDLTWAALEIELYTPHTLKESSDLTRVGRAEIERTPDGIFLDGPMLEAIYRLGIMSRDALDDTDGAGFQGAVAGMRAAFDSTPAYLWITTPENTRHSQIAAGRAWVRQHLAATQLGLTMQPVSQALQEYAEMAELYARVHETLAAPGETVQMLGRFGYAPQVPPAPRWPLETRLRNG